MRRRDKKITRAISLFFFASGTSAASGTSTASKTSGLDYSAGENSSLPTPQSGQTKSSATCSHGVPGATPSAPTAGSYSQPQTSHMYLVIIRKFKVLIFYREYIQ